MLTSPRNLAESWRHSAKAQNRTPSSNSKATPKRTSTSKPTSTPLPTLSNDPHLHDPAERFAAARLESLLPTPFLISASETRQNVILPPSAPKPTPTRYTILFDAAHALIMHQSVASCTANSSGLKHQLDELTRISHRQAKFILDLEAENAKLRALAVNWGLGVPGASQSPSPRVATTATAEVTKREKKRGGKEKRKEPVAYADGLGNERETNEQGRQREERERKMQAVLRQQERLMQDADTDEVM
jgi:hypothetical protein